MAAIDDARWAVYQPKIDWALRTELGITLAEWHGKFVLPAEFDFALEAHGMQTIRGQTLNVSTIVGGFIEENVMFFCAKGMHHIQSESSPGLYVIGSGSQQAMKKLNARGQNLSFGLARTVFHVHEAMLSAQENATVGPPTGYLVLMKNQPPLYIPPDSHLLASWMNYYSDKETTPLDTEEPNFAIQTELRPAQLPPYDKGVSPS